MATESLYRRMYTSFWNDLKVSRMLMEEKMVFNYIITSPHSNLAECYELPIEIASKEIGIHSDELTKILHSLRDKWKVIDFDDDSCEVLVCNRGKYEWSSSPQVLKGVRNACKDIKNKSMRDYIDFLTTNKYCEKTWDRDICDYYTGSWKKEVKK